MFGGKTEWTYLLDRETVRQISSATCSELHYAVSKSRKGQQEVAFVASPKLFEE
jgi:hypothetical protein